MADETFLLSYGLRGVLYYFTGEFDARLHDEKFTLLSRDQYFRSFKYLLFK